MVEHPVSESRSHRFDSGWLLDGEGSVSHAGKYDPGQKQKGGFPSGIFEERRQKRAQSCAADLRESGDGRDSPPPAEDQSMAFEHVPADSLVHTWATGPLSRSTSFRWIFRSVKRLAACNASFDALRGCALKCCVCVSCACISKHAFHSTSVVFEGQSDAFEALAALRVAL